MAVRSRERAEKYLYQQLGSLKAGGRMPSLRKIINDCEISQLVAQDVLKEMESRDLIYSINRRGYFKSDHSESDKHLEELDLIYCPGTHEREPMLDFHGSFSHFIGMFCGKKWLSIRMHFLEDHADVDNISKIAGSSKCRACILVSSSTQKIGEVLRDNYVSYVNLFPNADQLDNNSCNIVIDNSKVVTLQVEYLLELGHKKIAYLHLLRPGETIRDLQMRREGFFKLALEKGLETRPDWVRFAGYETETTQQVVQEILNGEQRPSAIICSDMNLPAVYRALESNGLTPGRDCSVIGENNLGISRVLCPSATSIDMSVEEAARKSLVTLERVMQDSSYTETIYIEPKLIKRDSTAPFVQPII